MTAALRDRELLCRSYAKSNSEVAGVDSTTFQEPSHVIENQYRRDFIQERRSTMPVKPCKQQFPRPFAQSISCHFLPSPLSIVPTASFNSCLNHVFIDLSGKGFAIYSYI